MQYGGDNMPKRPDGSRIVDEERSYIDTWADMEKLLKSNLKTARVGAGGDDPAEQRRWARCAPWYPKEEADA